MVRCMSTSGPRRKDNIPDGYELTNEVTYDILSSEKGVTGFITTLTNSHTAAEDKCGCEEGMG